MRPGLTTVAGEVVYFGQFFGAGPNYYFYAVDIQSGQEKWKFPIGAPGDFSSPAISDGVVYFGSGDSYLYALK